MVLCARVCFLLLFLSLLAFTPESIHGEDPLGMRGGNWMNVNQNDNINVQIQ